MNFIDIIVLIPVCWYGFKGFRHGLICEITTLVAILLGVWLAYKFSGLVAVGLPKMMFSGQMAFVLVFLAALVLVHLLGNLVQKAVKQVLPPVVDRVFGLLFGITKVLVVVSVIFYMFDTLDPRGIILKKEKKEASLFYGYIEPIVPHALSWKSVAEK